MAQGDVAGHARAAQIQIAIFEPQGFVHLVGLVADVEGRVLGRVEDDHLGGQDLDVPRGQLRIFKAIGPQMDRARDLHDIFIATLGRGRVGFGGRLRIDGHLGNTISIPQIQKDQTAMVTSPVHPPGQGHRLALVLNPQFPAVVGFQHRSPSVPLIFFMVQDFIDNPIFYYNGDRKGVQFRKGMPT